MPCTARIQNGEMLTKIIDDAIVATRMAASVEPITVPVPPRMLTPPTTEAVMIVSSRLGGTVDWMTLSCVANRTAAMPTKNPWMAKALTTVACGSMPDRRAASTLPPTA